MNIVLKSTLLVASAAMLTACVEDDTYYSTQVTHTRAYYTNVHPDSHPVYYGRVHDRHHVPARGVVVVNTQESVASPRYSAGFSATVAPAAPPEHTYQPAQVAPAPQPVNPGYSAHVAPAAPAENSYSANVAPAAPAESSAPAPAASGSSATVAPAAPAESVAEAAPSQPEKKAEEAPAAPAADSGVSAVVAPAAPPE